MQIGKKGTFALAITLIGIIAIIFAINIQIQNNYTNNVFLETQAARELSIKLEQTTRVLDKALTDAINENFVGNDCTLPPGQINNNEGIKGKLNKVLDKIYEKTEIKCSKIENLNDEDMANDVLQITISNLNCTIKFEGIEVSQATTKKFKKKFYKNPQNNQCIIEDSVSNCQEIPNFNCP
jgi:hypothetical protein